MVHARSDESDWRPLIAAGVIVLFVVVYLATSWLPRFPDEPTRESARAPNQADKTQCEGCVPHHLRAGVQIGDNSAERVSGAGDESYPQEAQDQLSESRYASDLSEQALRVAKYQSGALWWQAFATVLAVLTATIAAFFAFRAARAADNTLEHARQSSERELRAYVGVPQVEFGRAPSPFNEIHFKFVQANFGKTPAYDCFHNGVIAFIPHPMPEEIPFPVIAAPVSRGSSFPGVPTFGHVLSQGPFSEDQITEILKGNISGPRLYAFGEIHYTDAFGKKHWTRYCYSFPGFHPGVQLAATKQWAALDALLSARIGSMPWESAGRYNETDDG